MFELLLGTGTGKYVSVFYPESGPGNKWLLAGTPQLGYFGPVDSSELMTYSAYTSHVIPTSGQNSLKPDRGWLKFFYKGKVIYYSKTQIGLASWDIVYQNGGVYGEDGPGLYTASTGPVNQRKPVTLKDGKYNYTLLPRLPHLTDGVNPTALPVGVAGEFAALMSRVTIGDSNPVFKPYYGQWETFPMASIGLIAYTEDKGNTGRNQGIETKSGATNNKVFYHSGFNASDNSKSYANEEWRAVLELESWEEVVYPNSGPGPIKLAVGDEQLGYFGEVSETELTTYTALKTHLGFTQGIVTSGSWLKFFWKGKVVFLSKTWCYAGLTWENLYKAGGVYGVDGPGNYPSPVGSPINQYKPMTITGTDRSWKLIPRTVISALTDPSAIAVSCIGTELAELIGRCCNEDLFGNSSMGQFANFTKVELGLNRVTMGHRSNSDNTTYALVTGYPSGIGWTTHQRLRKTDGTGYNQVFRMALVVEGDPITG